MSKTRKIRRHSGRVTPCIAVRGKKEEIIEQCLEPQEHWSDWDDYRDGFRDFRDRKKIKKERTYLAKLFNVKRSISKIFR